MGGTTIIVDSIISDNESSGDFGGIGVDWFVGRTLTISDSLVTRNKSLVGGGIGFGSNSVVNISHSTISYNNALDWGEHLQG